MPPKTESSRFDLDAALADSARKRVASEKLRGRVNAPPPSAPGVNFRTMDSKNPKPTPPPNTQEREDLNRRLRNPKRADPIINK
jgi:hypothetical protein